MNGTTIHLPECLNDDATYGLRGLCICDELRACEQRIMSLNPVALGVLIAQRARERALDEARAAVAATFTGWCADPTTCTDYEHVCGGRRDALAAIDALKEKP